MANFYATKKTLGLCDLNGGFNQIFKKNNLILTQPLQENRYKSEHTPTHLVRTEYPWYQNPSGNIWEKMIKGNVSDEHR